MKTKVRYTITYELEHEPQHFEVKSPEAMLKEINKRIAINEADYIFEEIYNPTVTAELVRGETGEVK